MKLKEKVGVIWKRGERLDQEAEEEAKEEAAVLVWRKVHRRMGRRKKESNAAPLSSTRGGRGDDLMTKICTKSFVVHRLVCVEDSLK